MTRDELIGSLRELLSTDSDLAFLAEIDEGVLAQIHQAVGEYVRRMKDAMDPVYIVMAQGTRFIPKFVLVRLSKPLSHYVMAQSTLHLDAKTAASLGAAMGLDRMLGIQKELIRAGEFEKVAEVSDETSLKLIGPLTQRIEDPAHLAKIVQHMQNAGRVATISEALSSEVRAQVGAYLEEMGRADVASRFR